MRVVTLVDYAAGGGAERTAVEITKRLATTDDCVFVASRLGTDADSDPAYAGTIQELEAAGVPFVGVGRTATGKVWEWRPLVRLLREQRPDVIHTHSWGSNAWGPALRALGGARAHVAHEQTPFARVGGFRDWGRQLVVNRFVLARFCDAVVVPSAWAREALIEHEGVPARRIHVIPNGPATLPSLRRERAEVRSELGLPADAPVAIVAAMLRPEKAQWVLLRAAAELTDRHPDLHVVIAGGGPPQNRAGTGPELQRLARELDIEPRVRLIGPRSDVSDVVAAADVAVLSSDHENLPLAVVEYMESGVPIVATAVGGVPELIRDGEDGLLVPPADPGAMAMAIDTVLNDPGAAKRRAGAARERRRQTFDWRSITSRVRDLYRDLLSR